MFPPSRIVCLTEETVETLYLLGQQDHVVGISGYVVRAFIGAAVLEFGPKEILPPVSAV